MIKKNYIPTINISSLLEKSFDTKPTLKIVKEIEKACLDVGFFQIIGHGIDQKQIKNICKVGISPLVLECLCLIVTARLLLSLWLDYHLSFRKYDTTREVYTLGLVR